MSSARLLGALLLILTTLTPVSAQRDESRAQLAELQATLKTLNWQSADFAGLSQLERCRVLMLMNHALEELGAAALAERDLLGTFLEQEGLFEECAANPPQIEPVARTFEDARKIAVALLRGPMSGSSYATELGNTSATGLAAYENLYDKTCRGKWEEFGGSAREVRGMAAFLKGKGRDQVKRYMTWALEETQRRDAEYSKMMAERRAAVAAKEKDEQEQQEQAAAEKARRDSQPAQRAIYAAHAEPATQSIDEDGDWYSGWYYGVLANRESARPHHRSAEFQKQARQRIEQRGGAAGAKAKGTGRRRP